MDDDDERKRRCLEIHLRLNFLEFFPECHSSADNILRTFVRKLQNDIKDEVEDLLKEENYEFALIRINSGLNAGSYLYDDSRKFSKIDMKLLVLVARCYNQSNNPLNALKVAEDALEISRDDLGAQVERVKAKYKIAEAGGDEELTKFEQLLQDEVPERVKETAEVADIIKKLSERLGRPTQYTTHTAPDLDWIPDDNVKIAKKAKTIHCQKKIKPKKVKTISDNAEPVFPKVATHPQSRSLLKTSSSKLASGLHMGKSPQKGVVNRVGEGTVSVPSVCSVIKKTHSPTSSKKPLAQISSAAKLARIPKFNHEMQYACDICFTRHGGKRLQPRVDGLLACADDKVHQCKQSRKVILVHCKARKTWCKVTPVSKALPAKVTPTVCKFGCKCMRGGCTFPHTNEERDLWIFMEKYKLQKLQEVMSAGQAQAEPSNTATRYANSSTTLLAQTLPVEKTHCSYCDKPFKNHWQLESHFLTTEHKTKIKSDSDKEWKYRRPPLKVAPGQYEECQEHKRGTCLFSESPENCTKAHSKEELDEWMERHRYIVMKIKKAKEKNLYAFMDNVLFSYNLGNDVIADELPGMDLTCSRDVKQFLSTEGKVMDSSYNFTWKFTLNTSTNKRLKQVFLLYDEHRTHFKLSQPPEPEAQLCPGNLIISDDRLMTYEVDVIFHSQILGSFNQWILFDNGTAPHLTRKLQVHVSSTEDHDEFDIKKKEGPHFEVWDSSNMKIVKFADYKLSSRHKELMAKYKVPSPLSTNSMDEMSRENYKEYMHTMLYLEEKECNDKISKFASEVHLKCLNQIKLTHRKFQRKAPRGTMYGQVDLQLALMDDSETSQIIERSVQRVMLKFTTSETIYEAAILDDEELASSCQDTLYIQLSPTCVSEQKLRVTSEHQVQIQLQLSRLSFCYMHDTVENLDNMDIVFPSKDNLQRLPLLDASGEGDRHQEQVINFICKHEGDGAQTGVGPVLVYGPFGTGKTYTLATAVKKTLQNRSDSKILICTKSNSAADLYITEHLHADISKDKILRIYAKNRDKKNINSTVHPYIRVNNEDKIIIPKTAVIKTFSVVITTLATSHRLVSGQLKGHFSHILVDEAGQALETETLQPLTLATDNTCIVLAGDHIQMSPKVFSKEARHANFDMSLLERLFHLKITRVLLPSNYRTNQAILDFISEAFYNGTSSNRGLKACGNHEPHPGFKHPLVFYTVKGEDQRIGRSFVNCSEVEQVVLNVKQIHDEWPEESFGKLSENSIGIVTPYILQVKQIRKRLQKLKLKHIDVQNVQNVQGKQYRVLIVSTVRTWSTLNTSRTQTWSKPSPVLQPDEHYYYGFLSDIRLLNTAMTRAQSLVVVVGDPMALCSEGKCSKIWQAYLEKCESRGTLFPAGSTMEMIYQGIEAHKQRLTISTPPPESKNISFPNGLPKPNRSETELGSSDQKGDMSNTDAILEELFKQMNKDESKATQMHRRKRLKFRMVEKNDHIALTQVCKSKRDRTKSNDMPYYEDDHVEIDEHDEIARQSDLNQVGSNPDKFKVCCLLSDETGDLYALPLNEDKSKKIFVAKGRSGQALHLDEVMVEILDNDVDNEKIHGKVIRLRKRGPTLSHKIVCRLDKYKGNLMVPVDRSLPKFYRTKNDARSSQDSTFVSAVDHDGSVSKICVSRRDKPDKLFVVEYYDWFEDNPFPVGIVRNELPTGDSKESGLRILKLCHGVQDNWKSSILGECESNFPDEWKIPDEVLQSRCDERGLNVFTIDPPGTRDIDDALSVEMVDGNYRVGIHIADVSYFVSKDTSLDEDAKYRATSFYSSLDEPTNMLPPRLSNNFCSLLRGLDRLTISIVVILDENGSVRRDNVVIMRSVIKSREQLTYEDAEKIIQDNADLKNVNPDIKEKIRKLSELAQKRRRARLRDGRFAFSHDSEEEDVLHPLSHSMVEEMMLLANEEVARYLTEKHPECVPLRRQLPPSEEAIDGWLSKHDKDLCNSVELQSKLPRQSADPNDVYMVKEKWEYLRHLVKEKDKMNQMRQITDLICSDQNHPQLAVAQANRFNIQKKAEYIRSGEHPGGERGHQSLGVSSYTQFTSPIRRYFDLVVHRFVISTLISNESAYDTSQPYSNTELEYICLHCNSQTIKSRKFERETRSLRFSLALREAPKTLQVFVKDFSNASLELLFSYKDFIPPRTRNVALGLLKPKGQPSINEAKTKMELKWGERVYELHGSSTIFRNAEMPLMLDTKTSVVKVSHDHWQRILSGILQQQPSSITEAVMVAERDNKQGQGQSEKRKRRDVVDEVTCERADTSSPVFSVNFMRDFERGDVVKVVLHSKMQKGFLTPSIQLFSLTPKLDLCIEHRANAVECFARLAEKTSAKVASIEEYEDIWLPIVHMVSAYNAVIGGERSIIYGVHINWQRIQETGSSPSLRGKFQLPTAFCDERNLKISKGDYLCIRYTNLTLEPEVKRRLCLLNKSSAETRRPSTAQQDKTTFVAHAILSDVQQETREVRGEKSKIKVVELSVNQRSSPCPSFLLTERGSDIPCTIEWIRKAQSDRRLEVAIQNLPSAPPIVQQICLQNIPVFKKGKTEPDIRKVLEAGKGIKSFCIPGSPFPAPNDPQEDALSHALQHQFTVIQGPPGTGKTVTGAHLTYFFIEVNKRLLYSGKPPQVLYCGPSNKSVDVVAHYMLKLNLSAIRVYNKMVQDKDFPMPGCHSATSSNEAKMDPDLKGISLHHLIRMRGNSYSEAILRFNQQFKKPGYKINPKELFDYRKTIRRAEAEELPKYKVVLCTCNEAGSKRIMDLNMIQCIVDECGMCTEPETLIPLVGAKPHQIVLIGDHKQLRPIIQEKIAKDLGMGISLLEKNNTRALRLTIQYRMHKSICDFPSQEFYNGKLHTADSVIARSQTSVKWPGGADNPIVFCHHIGREEHVSVRDEEGSERSKANAEEVQHVVRMASVLVNNLQVRPANLAVLTQYRHQKCKIEEGLKSKGLKIHVSTVITSQGKEWDYVIFSTVRSLPRVQIVDKPSFAWRKQHLGFITDANQINVAITRSKMGLIILGNKCLLRKEKTWNSLLHHYERKKAVVDANNFLRTSVRGKGNDNAK